MFKTKIYTLEHFVEISQAEILRRIAGSSDFSFINSNGDIVQSTDPYFPKKEGALPYIEKNVTTREKLWDDRPVVIRTTEKGLVQHLRQGTCYNIFNTETITRQLKEIVGIQPFDVRLSNKKGSFVVRYDNFEDGKERNFAYGLIIRTELNVFPESALARRAG